MKKICLVLLSALMFFCVSPATGQENQVDPAESTRLFTEWTKSLAEYVRDVNFTEKDLQSFISLYYDFNAIGGEQDGEEEFPDFKTILNNTAYRAWAESKGIDSEMWLKKSMRIIAVMMRNEIDENTFGDSFDMQTQLAELDEMRAQIGEEAYQQMTQALAAGAAEMEEMKESYKYLPVPTSAEKELLAKYEDELDNLE